MSLQSNLFCEVLRDARETGTAVAAINMLNYNTARAVIAAAQRAWRPVIVQPSVGTVRRYGVEELAAMVNSLRRGAKVPVVLHLDHCGDEDLARSCIVAGWDSVMVDHSALPLGENIRLTRRVAGFAHIRGVAVEGEVGVIAGVEDGISRDAGAAATYDDTVAYTRQTGVDAVAPAIGTAHGVYTGVPELDFDLVRRLAGEEVPVVVHGGTGLPEADFKRLIACGAAKINVSTALKRAYLDATRRALDERCAPVELDKRVEEACAAHMEAYIRLFAGEDVELYPVA